MRMRPRTSLGRILDDLGDTLLDLVHGDPDLLVDVRRDIGGTVIYDPVDEPVLPRNALVLGVGLQTVEEIAALLRELGKHGALGLVLRAPVPTDEALRVACDESGVAVLALTRGASWTQLAALLRSLLAEGDVGETDAETLGGMPSGDLFALANAVAALLDAPVTIEDRNSRVLAFSGRQDEADPSRIETILGRQVPERYSRMLTEQGVFRDLYRYDRPVFVPPTTDDSEEFALPRVAVAVRAGDEVLGSIWAAVRERLDDERERALCDAARLVALHMLRIRAGADVERRLRADLLSTALEGGHGAHDALGRLGLADQSMVVLALAVTGMDHDRSIDATAAYTAERQRVADAFAMHLSATHPRCASALVGDVVYGLMPVNDTHRQSGDERATCIAREFLGRIEGRVSAVVGVSPVAADVTQVARARQCADRALRVLRARSCGSQAARLDDVYVASVLLEMRDLAAAREDRPTGPLIRLIEYDRKHNGDLVKTLSAWLDMLGDVVAASDVVSIHPNTFRYRLRRVSEISGLDLNDPEVRFAAMLQLRLLGMAEL